MVAAALWDLSGQSQKTALPSGTRSETSAGADTARSQGTTTTSASSSVSTRNTPEFALDALNKLVNSLMDKPNVSEAELDRLAPMPLLSNYASYGQYGFSGYDLNGYHRDLRNTKAKRESLQKEGGYSEGGTIETRRASGQRQEEIVSARSQREKYSKEAAFDDASALNSRFARQMMEQLMPNITKSIEASGTSGGAVAGLLAQDVAARTAEAQASLGLNTAVQYGQLSNQMSVLLEALTKENSPVAQLLLQALGTAKGTINEGEQSSTQTATEDKTITTNKQAMSDVEQQGRNTPYSLVQNSGQPGTSTSSAPTYGMSANPSQIADLLAAFGKKDNTRLEAFSFG